jgi:hypothetical protein
MAKPCNREAWNFNFNPKFDITKFKPNLKL